MVEINDLEHERGREGCKENYLAESALHRSKEVSFLHPIVVTADVVQLIAEPLHLLKVVVQGEDLGEGGIDAAADNFSSVHLQKGQKKPSLWNKGGIFCIRENVFLSLSVSVSLC